MTEREKLEEQFRRIRQKAIDNNEPTAIVLAENRVWGQTQLTIESFSIRDFIDQYGDEAGIRVYEACCYGKPVWVVDMVAKNFISDPDAFEMAWQSREYYHSEWWA